MPKQKQEPKTELTETITKIQQEFYIQYGSEISKIRIRFIIDKLLKDIKNKISKGEDYTIYTFGKFYPRRYPARVINNYLAENVEVEDHNVPGFTPAPELTKSVRYPKNE